MHNPAIEVARLLPEKDQMAITNNTLEALLNEYQVAELTALSVATLRRRRTLKQLTHTVRTSASVRYRPKDVHAWIDSCATDGSQTEAL